MQSKSDNVGIFVTAFYLLFELHTVSINALSCRPTCTFSESHLLCPLHTIYRIHSEYIHYIHYILTYPFHYMHIMSRYHYTTTKCIPLHALSIIVLSAFPDDPPQC